MKKLILMSVVFSIQVLAVADVAKEAAPYGTGPIRVECTDAKDVTKAYNVNEVLFSGNGNKTLVARGFGPNRQDDSIAVLEGDCAIFINEKN